MIEFVKLLLILLPFIALIVGGYYVFRNYNPACEHGEAWEEECADCERYF
jgi:hypothetical protein